MKDANTLVIVALLTIAMASLGIVGFIVWQSGPTEPLNQLILIASNVASGLIGFLTGGVVKKLKEPKNA